MCEIKKGDQEQGKSVLILGAGFAGLIIAARLVDFGFQVTLVERDAVNTAEKPTQAREQLSRRLPASDYNHVLMGDALDQLISWWPDCLGALNAASVPIYSLKDWMSEEQLEQSAHEEDEKPLAACLSRALLEQLWLDRLRDHLLCEIVDNTAVVGLSGFSDGERYHVNGVRVKRHGEMQCIDASIVIDAMGRESKWLEWVNELGIGAIEHSWPNTRQLIASHYEVNSQKPFLLSRHVFGFMNTLAVPAEGQQVCLMLDVPRQEERFWRSLWANENFESVLCDIPEFKEWFVNDELQPIGPIVGYCVPHWWRRSFMKGERAILQNYFPVGEALMSLNPAWLLGSLIAVKTAKSLVDALCSSVDDATTDRYGCLVDAELEPVMIKVQQIESMVDSLSAAQHQGATIPLSISLLHETYFGLHHLARTDLDALRVVIRSEMWLDDPIAVYQNPVRWLRHWRQWVKWRIQDEGEEFRLPDRREILSKVGAA